ncbi:hypothetical protein [Rhodobacter ferrooxidans]|uniref:Uncharacterized protein n=1 Tax=Rhodobacter ferrooxidans TaxID=371731 RepID=C8S5E5_9RHOB|nr:hypothetical protein [Rhodobacter sp. SW2]EEW23817.1 conserved hypothetical protein [Rhodobacter sp. SW2]
MKSVMLSAVLATACCASGAAVMAQDLESYATVGVWEVLIDPTIGNGCLINAEFEDGSDVRIGFDRAAGTGYLMAMNAAWGEIVVDQDYPISFDLDGTSYDGVAKGVVLDDLPGVDIPFDSIEFLTGLAASNTMTLSSNGTEVMKIDLTDSDKALVSAIECQDKQG